MGEFDQRWDLIYPADNEDALPDGKTKSTPSDLRVDETDWGDVLQALIWLRNRHDGAVGDLADRPDPGSDAPRKYTTIGATDSAPTIYYNDESVPEWAAVSSGDADTLDGLDSTQFLRSDADDTWKASSLTVEGPDDTSGTVTIQPGADTGSAGTPSMDFTVDGTTTARGPLVAEGDIHDAMGVDIWSAASQHVPVGSQQAGFGASDEVVLLGSSGSGAGTPTTTSTTYTTVLSSNHVGVLPTEMALRTGISGYALSAVLEISNDTAGETTSARVYDVTNGVSLSNTEVTHTGAGSSIHHTPIVAYDPGNTITWNIEMKVTAGTGGVDRNPAVLMWGIRS